MPELPEVETVRRGLAPVMEGEVIARAEVRRPDLRWPFPERMAERLSGQRVERLRRRSKYILADLASGETLLIHLGMSGRLLIEGKPTAAFHHEHPAPGKHDHVLFHMQTGTRVTFNDPRRFGAMDLLTTATAQDHKLLAKIGPEPLSNAFSAETLLAAFKSRRAPVRSLLLDQSVVAGLGNIYVAEALWRAGIHPMRPSGKISRPRLETLTTAIRDTLNDAIAAGGSSLRDYRQADGDLGYFQHSFAAYDRAGEPCRKPGCTGTITRQTHCGRSSYHCPTCQR